MATRGTPPKPTALRLVEQGGKLRAKYRERARREPVACVGLPSPPDHLSAEQLRLWRDIEKHAPPGLLTMIDAHLIEGYVLLLSARNDAARQWNAAPVLLVPGKDPRIPLVPNPLLRVLRALNGELLAMQAQLGYTPAGRTRIAVTPPGHGDEPRGGDDPLARFFGKRAQP